jgi:hypothetical protein
MSEDRQSKKDVIVLGSGSAGVSRLATQAAAREVVRIHGEHATPHVEVMEDRMKPSEMAVVLGALEANGISTSLPEPPRKQPKQPVPPEIQERKMAAAEAKRERKRLKRLRSVQESR